jgi:hypothetical protein
MMKTKLFTRFVTTKILTSCYLPLHFPDVKNLNPMCMKPMLLFTEELLPL